MIGYITIIYWHSSPNLWRCVVDGWCCHEVFPSRSIRPTAALFTQKAPMANIQQLSFSYRIRNILHQIINACLLVVVSRFRPRRCTAEVSILRSVCDGCEDDCGDRNLKHRFCHIGDMQAPLELLEKLHVYELGDRWLLAQRLLRDSSVQQHTAHVDLHDSLSAARFSRLDSGMLHFLSIDLMWSE